jgi:hypothetical protein
VALPVRGADGEVAAVVGIAFDDEREFSGADLDLLTARATVVLDDPRVRG